MSGKKMEGDAQQRRNKAREAREAGKKPSEVGATLGASKQRKHVGDADTVEKFETRHEGKQESALKGKGHPDPRAKREHRTEEPMTRHERL